MTAAARCLAIVQARMSSSRLPGKVLLDIGGRPMLARVVERTRRAGMLQDVVVATTTDASDDPVAQFCAEQSYACFRGSLSDVLDRYYRAACAFEADKIVRITADCPIIDADIVDRVVRLLQEPEPAAQAVDFAASRLPPPWGRSLPIGLDVEAVTFAALERAWKEADRPFQREHVMPFFYEGTPVSPFTPDAAGETWSVQRDTSPRGFRIAQLHHHPDYGALRWTVDTAADLDLLRVIYAAFENEDDFTWRDVLALFKQRPELAAINAHVEHKTAFHVG
ncbi:MAG: cytidylyltransferase domain-containing protein [Chloroflexota bacterium]